ncbi:MucB/RseB C-terminal domain-containing protein [Thalassolituus sp. LLYu03]|uniref:MucB/RseB C-terminal domain-containing protein n=1 Tax=Thalassolituus sp. LLYu03 TaxID=3421656 RepID=UPI003D26E77F
MKSRLLLSLLLSAMTAQADEGSAREWLERMNRAFHQTSYQGVLIYGNDHQWETLAVSHAVLNGIEHEKVRHLTGVPREIIRRGDETLCIHPGEHNVRLGNSLPVPLQGYSVNADLGEHYEFHLGDANRVAGRYARVLDVMPRDETRYGYRLWLDQDSALLLRSELVSDKQQVLERFQFADIQIGLALGESDFNADGEGHPLVGHFVEEEGPAPDANPEWLPQWLPSGFVLASAGRVDAEGVDAESALPSLRLMYTDGLAAFTLFVDPAAAEPDDLPEMMSQWGATAAVVRYRQQNDVRYRITAVGELPPETMTRIASSVAYHSAP